jgi:hypothetical protein
MNPSPPVLPRRRWPEKRLLPVLAAVLAAAPVTHGMAQTAASGEARLQWETRPANAAGPLAEALALQPGLAAMSEEQAVTQVEIRHSLRLPLPATAPRVSVQGQLLLRHEWPQDLAARDASRVNELNLNVEAGAWAFSAGKKVLGWGVGYAFRPNDVVQQEERRSLSGTSPEGRPLLQAEYFDADSAYSLVWVNPNTWGRSAERAPAAQESALAARAYWRRGALDLHGFARLGERTKASLGAAAAWVPGEATEWHASLRWLQRHETWVLAGDPLAGPSLGNPWQTQRLGRAAQALVGLNWTGEQQQSVLLEAWHDGNAPSDATWRAWGTHSAALRASPAPVAARAGNLAWQTTPLNGPGLRQDNLFARLSWQPGAWQWWGDVLYHPADGGRSLSAGMQWQGDRWRLQASLRTYGGRQDSVLAQLPTRRQALLAASLAF